MPTWTTLGFGAPGDVYGAAVNESCEFGTICPATYGHPSNGASIRRVTPGSGAGIYAVELGNHRTSAFGGSDVLWIRDAPAGAATLSIRYANGAKTNQTLRIGVNDHLLAMELAPTGGWSRWSILNVPVVLRAGNNIVTISAIGVNATQLLVSNVATYRRNGPVPEKVAATLGHRSHYLQSLDMRSGTVTTSFDWTSPSGLRSSFQYEVAPNRAKDHLGTVHLVVVPHWSGMAVVVDEFDPRGLDYATVRGATVTGASSTLSEQVLSAGDMVTAALASVLRVDGRPMPTTPVQGLDGRVIGQEARFPVQAGKEYRITKFVGVASSVDTDRDLAAATPQQVALQTARGAAAAGYREVAAENDQAWARLWRSGISVPGDTTLTARIHAAMFYLLASLRKGVTWSTSPGGLSSDGYNGHVFWDMETWMYPALLVQHPGIAVTADAYRQKLLPAAEAEATRLSTPAHPIHGAKFPWESALTGIEAIPPGNPEGKDEIHIDSDIALAQWQYYEASGDKQWLRDKAWPVLHAIADYWATRAVRGPAGQYDINDVQGADEYHDGVNNSASTNAGARASLRIAIEAAGILGLKPNPAWETVADGLVIPFDPVAGIHPEFDGYAGQTIKQADVTLMQYPWRVPMSPIVAANDLDYYSLRTDINGPSMTDAIAAIDTAALGLPGCSAYTYMLSSIDPFIAPPFDQFHETRSGGAFTFTTGEGGFLQEFLYGFTGLRWGTKAVTLNPSLPPQLPGLDITRLKWHGRVFDLHIGRDATTVRLVAGAPLPIRVRGQVRIVTGTLTIPTRQPAAAPTTDLARCAKVTASSTNPSYPAVAAVDGSSATWWQADHPGASLTVDLGRLVRVSEIDVASPAALTPYKLEVSTDDTHWTTVAIHGASALTAVMAVLGRPTTARYVRYASTSPAIAKVSTLAVRGRFMAATRTNRSSD
ncbi:MAG TPA: discoidin domain-containing protein [Rhodanobacteraceae bacterium]